MSRYNRIHALTVMTVVVTTALSLVGCTQKRQTVEQTTAKTPDEPTSDACLEADEMDFLDRMTEQPNCTFAHAVRAVAMLINGSDVGPSHAQRYQFLLERDVVRCAWNLHPDQRIDRGTLAFMLYRAIGLKGGVNMVMFAQLGIGDRRFAYREMLYRNLMLKGADYNYVSGPELVTAVGKADCYMQDTGRYAPEDDVRLGETPPTQ